MFRSLMTSALFCTALLSSASALAQEVPTVTVRFADLNLAAPEGAAALRQRIDLAAMKICAYEPAYDTHPLVSLAKCKAEVMARVRPQMDTVLASAREGHGLAQAREILLAGR